MKFLRKQIDKVKPFFDKGGKYEKFGPAFAGFETFLYVPDHTTSKGAHIRDGVDLKRVMMIVVLALLPALIFGTWNIGYQNMGDGHSFWEYFSFGGIRILPMIIISYGVGLGIEFAYAVFRGHSVNEGYLVTGLLIPMIMPIDMPLWMLTISVIFAVIIGKEAFGGTGMNILNPALVARAFALFSYAPFMSGSTVWVADSVADGVSGETVLGTLAANNIPTTSVYDMFMGFMPGSIGETSVLMILIGAAFLLFTGMASWRIMLSSLIGASIMGFVFNLIGSDTNELFNYPWWKHLLVGGFAFGIVFMATDPVTAAQTTRGKWIYGFLIGIFAILIRIINPTLPEGMMMAILLMNVFAPTIDHYVIESNIKKRKKRLQKVKA